jgi:predicted GNAT family N-acyltransferase
VIEVRGADAVLLPQALQLRHEVFVLEQGVPAELEYDAADATALHLVAVDDALVVGTGRMVVEPAGYSGIAPALGPVGHLGRLAVRASARGQGIGVLLVRALEATARAEGLAVVALGAQLQALGFYQRLGYAEIGDIFDDAGIAHRTMFRTVGG